MAKIFLCHANEDKSQVREVYRRLKAEGFEPWLDEEDLLPGQLWNQEIHRALRSSNFILIFFSQNSVLKQGYVQREMKLALDTWEEVPGGQIHTIPIRLDACEIPERFKPFQWVDLFGDDGFEKIIRAIRFQLQQSQPDQQVPPRPLEGNLSVDATAAVDEVRYVKNRNIGLYLWGDPDPREQSEEERSSLRQQRRYVETASGLAGCQEALVQLNEIIPDIFRKLSQDLGNKYKNLNVDELRKLRQKFQTQGVYNTPLAIHSMEFKISAVISNNGGRVRSFRLPVHGTSIPLPGWTKDASVAECMILSPPQDIYTLSPRTSVKLEFYINISLRKPIFQQSITYEPEPFYNWLKNTQELTNDVNDDELLNRMELRCDFLDDPLIFSLKSIAKREKLNVIKSIDIKRVKYLWEHIRTLVIEDNNRRT
jgi:hypothetical protein